MVTSEHDEELPHGAGEVDYGRCWEAIGSVREYAYLMVDESRTEEELRRKGKFMADALVVGLDIGRKDTVLDIGCGVARIGRELMGRVGRWIGVDVSGTMLAIAEERMGGWPDVELHRVDGADLAPLADACADRIYCHAVLIHMDKEDLYGYLLEARRVLKPEGLFYFDVWNLCHEAGWLRWEFERLLYPTRAHRPIHRNQFSTPDEIRSLLSHAGLVPLALAESHQIQAVASYTADPGEDEAAFTGRMAARHGRCYDHLRWGKDHIDQFEELIRRRLDEHGYSQA